MALTKFLLNVDLCLFLVAAVVNVLRGIPGADVPGSCQILVIQVVGECMSQLERLLLTTTLYISSVIAVVVVVVLNVCV